MNLRDETRSTCEEVRPRHCVVLRLCVRVSESAPRLALRANLAKGRRPSSVVRPVSGGASVRRCVGAWLRRVAFLRFVSTFDASPTKGPMPQASARRLSRACVHADAHAQSKAHTQTYCPPRLPACTALHAASIVRTDDESALRSQTSLLALLPDQGFVVVLCVRGSRTKLPTHSPVQSSRLCSASALRNALHLITSIRHPSEPSPTQRNAPKCRVAGGRSVRALSFLPLPRRALSLSSASWGRYRGGDGNGDDTRAGRGLGCHPLSPAPLSPSFIHPRPDLDAGAQRPY